MKLTIILFLLTVSCFSQTEKIVSLAKENIFDTPNGTYLKDVDDRFSPYLGDWEYEDSIYRYSIRIFSKLHVLNEYPNGDYHYKDQILATYKVTNIKLNSIIFDSQQNDTFNKEFWAFGYNEMKKRLSLNFYDSNGGDISIELQRKKRLPNILYFSVAYVQVFICGDINFDKTICPLPKKKSKFKRKLELF